MLLLNDMNYGVKRIWGLLLVNFRVTFISRILPNYSRGFEFANECSCSLYGL